MKNRIPFILLAVILLISACTPRAEVDIRGEWEYTMVTENGNTYDTGTIVFSGQPGKGAYLETNIYDVEYQGEFSVSGNAIKLTGDETWEGIITATAINGTWSHDDGESGTFNAVKK